MTSRRTPTTKLDRLIAKRWLQLTCDPSGISHVQCKFRQNYKLASQEIIAWLISGCKENHFYSCHSSKLKLAFTSPYLISTSPKNFLTRRIDFIVLLLFEFLKNITCPLDKLKTEFTSPIAKSTSPGLSDTRDRTLLSLHAGYIRTLIISMNWSWTWKKIRWDHFFSTEV